MSARFIRYTLDGIKLTHDIGFGVTDGDGFDVYVNRAKLDKGIDYKVVGTDEQLRSGDGAITLTIPHAASDVLLILSDTLARRVTNFAKAARFEEAEIDNEFDNLLRLLEDAALNLQSTPYFDPTDVGLVDGKLPPIIAEGILRVNADGNGFELIKLDEIDELQDLIKLASDEADRSKDEADRSKVEADKSKLNADKAQVIAESIEAGAGDYKGLWPDSGGTAEAGDIWQTQAGGSPTGRYYTALINTTTSPTEDNVNWKESVTKGSLPSFTDMVYRSLGGRPAIEAMLDDLRLNPIMYAVGTIIKTGGTTWVYKDSTGPITIDNFRAFNVLNVIDCGAVGDKQVDNYEAITYARSVARQKGLTLFFPELYFYTSKTLNLGGVRVYAERAGYTDPIYAKKPDGTNFVSGGDSADWNYYYNSTQQGRDVTWRTHLESAVAGAAIISDTASPIITLDDGDKFDIDGLGVVGNHRLKGQHGVAQPLTNVYKGNSHRFNNMRITGCGGNALHLPKGWETSSMDNCIFTGNNGYGLYTGVIDDGGTIRDSATEYLNITNSGGSHNRLGCFYFEQFRKHLQMDNVFGNNNGQYDSPSANGRIDPLLGYDRNIPSRDKMAALIWINDVTRDSVGQTGTCQNLHFKNIWGEQTAKAIHIRGRERGGIIRNVTFDNLSFIRLAQLKNVPVKDPANGCMIYMDVKYLADVDIRTFYPQSLYPLDVESVDFTENNIRALGWTPVTAKEFSFLHWKYEGTLGAFTFAAAQPIVREEFTAPSVNTVQTTGIIKNIHTYYPAQGVLAPISKWRIYGQHQATNAEYYGIYELSVFRNNKGQWKGVANQVAVDVSGDSFTAAPTITTDGMLNLPTRAFSMVRVEIMEGLTWIGGLEV
ncbi:hypothetical protein VPHK411_0013 [Vibrio phage K411]